MYFGTDRRKRVEITDKTIEYVAALAKLELTEEEKEKAKTDMGSILGYITTMNELDTEGVKPMSHVFPIHNVFREDVVENGPDRDILLQNAPAKKDGCFMVPKTVE
ncbi:Asp-tRNA(Asn)/Glu-tRNA(Gln) amidotransferase subunit GatC [Anaerocolumna jejuensis]|jgi:aspartyl-tRNA(Asn)/glutamyl-tRNA(Gln) amidotransferase subunit C|uniref:Asp-tRNA(Asn)/Glu-tRNA(Gln) amidotransferase subunit GatC n=1 Tax=Anaerocolumna jejuensis TaxID=259063 RepID=UPI0009356113